MLTPDQRTFYDQTGYVHLPAALPVDLLIMAESVLRRWQNGIIAQWLEAGLVEDAGEQVGFSQRLHQLWIRAGKPRYSRSPRRDLVGKQKPSVDSKKAAKEKSSTEESRAPMP